MLLYLLVVTLFTNHCVVGQFGAFKQDFNYVTVREGAHMFYWLFYTTAPVDNYTERPLIVWLQGGPGSSSTGVGNFDILGPLDLSLQERNHTWVKNFNVLFVDNPVGAGFSYVDDLKYLTKNNGEIALDFVNLMRGFYENHNEFENIPLYIYGQSYGGKMTVDIALRMHEAEKAGTIRSNLRGIAMGNAWISPIDLTLSWAPLLLSTGLVEETGYDDILTAAREAERLYNLGQLYESIVQVSETQEVVYKATANIDFHNILTKMPPRSNEGEDRTAYERTRFMMIHDKPYVSEKTIQEVWDLDKLMNTQVKPALNIPANVTWGSQKADVFEALRGDLVTPVTDGIEKLLNETDIIVTKYNGNMDLMCPTAGQMQWVNRLKWAGAEGYRTAARHPIWVDNRLEGYYKSFGNFRFFWINVAGHSAPRDNPAVSNTFLQDMTSIPLP